MVYNYIQLEDNDTFTASTPTIPMSAGRYIDYLSVYVRGSASDATANSVSTIMALLNPFTVFLKGSPCFQMNMEDTYAYDVLVHGVNPFAVVATAATSDQTKVGVLVPLWQPPRVAGELKYQATHVSQTHVGSEVITVMEASSTKNLMPKYLHAVTLSSTSAGATGYGNRIELGVIPGELEALLIRSATIPTNSADTATVQYTDLYANNVKIGTREWREQAVDGKIGFHALFASPADATILDNYRVINMRFDPIERGTNVRLDYNTQATASAARFTPIYAI